MGHGTASGDVPYRGNAYEAAPRFDQPRSLSHFAAMRSSKLVNGISGYAGIEALEARQLLAITLDPVGDMTYPGGKAIFVPITGTTTGSSRLVYDVSTSDSRISARVLQNITFIDINVTIGGVAQAPMRMALFHDIAPNTVSRFLELVNSGFYTGKPFQRIIDGFMAQGGGTSGTTLDDEFHPDAIFDTPGLLAMANANGKEMYTGDPVPPGRRTDTNDAQFFITFDETRWLDFRHTIFGQLVRGRATLNAIAARGSSDGTPSQAVTITSISTFQDLGDAVLVVKGPVALQGAVAVTAQGSDGAASQTFRVLGIPDLDYTGAPINTRPYLGPVHDLSTLTWKPASLKLTAVDLDGDPPQFSSFVWPSDSGVIDARIANNTLIVTPKGGFSGTAYLLVSVYQPSPYGETWDSQWIAVHVTNPLQIDSAGRTLHISGTGGNDKIALSAQSGTLSVTYNGHTKRLALASFDKIIVNLDEGNDSVTAAAGVPPMVVYGGAGNDTIRGGGSADSIYGQDGNDSIRGNGGDDRIEGAAGSGGDDAILGGSGNDTLLGEDGADSLRGDAGDDSVDGGLAGDSIYGGAGNDTITAVDGSDSLFGDAGDDYLYVQGDSPLFTDNVNGGKGINHARKDDNDVLLYVEDDALT